MTLPTAAPNVIVLSAAILAIAFFHLSFKANRHPCSASPSGQRQSAQGVLALNAVLACASLRYRFDAATGEELKAIPDEFEEFVARGHPSSS